MHKPLSFVFSALIPAKPSLAFLLLFAIATYVSVVLRLLSTENALRQHLSVRLRPSKQR
jgi:hypothetical protein